MSQKPPYSDKFPCTSCGTGYRDCAGAASVGLKCCADCDGHPERWSIGYTPEELAEMYAARDRGSS